MPGGYGERYLAWSGMKAGLALGGFMQIGWYHGKRIVPMSI
jgi:hypothetical protein